MKKATLVYTVFAEKIYNVKKATLVYTVFGEKQVKCEKRDLGVYGFAGLIVYTKVEQFEIWKKTTLVYTVLRGL